MKNATVGTFSNLLEEEEEQVKEDLRVMGLRAVVLSERIRLRGWTLGDPAGA